MTEPTVDMEIGDLQAPSQMQESENAVSESSKNSSEGSAEPFGSSGRPTVIARKKPIVVIVIGMAGKFWSGVCFFALITTLQFRLKCFLSADYV
jgi:hypothetical protein